MGFREKTTMMRALVRTPVGGKWWSAVALGGGCCCQEGRQLAAMRWSRMGEDTSVEVQIRHLSRLSSLLSQLPWSWIRLGKAHSMLVPQAAHKLFALAPENSSRRLVGRLHMSPNEALPNKLRGADTGQWGCTVGSPIVSMIVRGAVVDVGGRVPIFLPLCDERGLTQQ